MKKDYVLITPAYNEEGNIERVINSVIVQTIPPQKWLIVNDGSTDGTDEIIKQYEARYNFITSLQLEREDIGTYYSHRTRVVLTGYKLIEKLKFDFLGRLFEFKLPNWEFVTQGGLPMISKLLLITRFESVLKSKSKTL